FAVAEGTIVGGDDLAARRLEHALARRGVPFVGRTEARVDVGLALGDHAELQRRARLDALGDGEAVVAKPDVEVAVDGMAAACGRDQPIGRRGAGLDRLEGCAFLALFGPQRRYSSPQ